MGSVWFGNFAIWLKKKEAAEGKLCFFFFGLRIEMVERKRIVIVIIIRRKKMKESHKKKKNKVGFWIIARTVF